MLQKFLREIVKVPYLLEYSVVRTFLDLDNQTDDVVLTQLQSQQLNNMSSCLQQTPQPATPQSPLHF